MKKTLRTKIFCCVLLLILQSGIIKAQFSISGQVRTRSELRAGQGTLPRSDSSNAFFTSQRTRINLGYGGYRFKLYTSIQDVRVWGQDGSSINRNTTDLFDGLMLHEAWGEIQLNDTGATKIENLSIKIGRQELVYDDARLLGNLDWLQQARRHDAILFKFVNKGWTAHLAGAYNQNGENKLGNMYNGTPAVNGKNTYLYPSSTNGVSTMYKSMQFLYLSKKLYFGTPSLLVFKDDFTKHKKNNVDSSTIKGVNSRITIGVNIPAVIKKKLTTYTSFFYQTGKSYTGKSINAYLVSISASYAISRKLSSGFGVDLTSGEDTVMVGKTTRFDPLYGTPHKFWGYMDYFYVADGFGPNNGLADYYWKTKYKLRDNLTLNLDAHYFKLPNEFRKTDGTNRDASLGTEIDFVAQYSLTKAINFEFGYSHMFATSTLTDAKTIKAPVTGVPHVKPYAPNKTDGDWAYLMISIKPSELILK